MPKIEVQIRFFDSQKSRMFFEGAVEEIDAADAKRFAALGIFGDAKKGAVPKAVILGGKAEKTEPTE